MVGVKIKGKFQHVMLRYVVSGKADICCGLFLWRSAKFVEQLEFSNYGKTTKSTNYIKTIWGDVCGTIHN